ncbi:homeodomain-like, No apical meristem-associated domain protein [Artemisia annua]|uniref:Homeodomain-like, No apical meristem-associated domain protein n=1 Tax=Artemisia annua TaxID=35608 RepID=A0A2U1LGT8_ARTAN|nr:homeodomain-like, No apical meristem-associated domain protein [Artemisia annua]
MNPENENDSTPDGNPNKKMKCTKNDWTREEDLVLVKGWLQVSEDGITNKSQRKKDFWRCITAYYESNNTSGIPRTLKKIKGHWHYMNPLVVAFNNEYLLLKGQKHTEGWCEHDFKGAMQDKYKAAYGSYFRHEHVWDLVKHEQKWVNSTSSETSRISYEPASYIKVNDTEDSIRLNGSYIAKEAQKGRCTKLLHDSQSHINVDDNEDAVRPIGTNISKEVRKEYPARLSYDSQSHINVDDNEDVIRPISTNVENEGRKGKSARLPYDSQHHINVDDNEDAIRPMGAIIAKESQNGKCTPTSSSSKNRADEMLEKHVEEYKKSIDRHYGLKEKKIRVEEEKLKIEANKLKNKEIAILFMDPEKMADFAKEVWRKRCEEIKEKYNL